MLAALSTVWVLDPDGRWHEVQWNPSKYSFCILHTELHGEPVYHRLGQWHG